MTITNKIQPEPLGVSKILYGSLKRYQMIFSIVFFKISNLQWPIIMFVQYFSVYKSMFTHNFIAEPHNHTVGSTGNGDS